MLLILSSGDTSILQVVLGKDPLFTESSRIVIALRATVLFKVISELYREAFTQCGMDEQTHNFCKWRAECSHRFLSIVLTKHGRWLDYGIHCTMHLASLPGTWKKLEEASGTVLYVLFNCACEAPQVFLGLRNHSVTCTISCGLSVDFWYERCLSTRALN